MAAPVGTIAEVPLCERWKKGMINLEDRLEQFFFPTSRSSERNENKKEEVGKGLEKGAVLRTRLRHLLDEYLRDGYVHSVKLLARPNISAVDRSLWVLCITLCGVLMLYVLRDLWNQFLDSPSQLVVEETEQALWDFPFPSVTICPRHKLRRSVALSFFSRAVNGNIENEQLIVHALRALEELQIPIRSDLIIKQEQHVIDKAAALMEGVNITHVMMQALPTCKDVFRSCHWAGREIDCCSIFDFQLTTRGLCYAFNSLTSSSRLKCQSPGSGDCQLIRNSGTGSSSGLEVFLRHTNFEEQLLPDKPRVGFGIIVQSPLQMVDVERGVVLMYEGRGEVTTAAVSYTTTRSSSWLETLPVAQRGCLLPHEWKPRPNAPATYSREGCLLQCRADFARKICKCHLYFAAGPDDDNTSIIPCGIKHLQCLADIRAQLLFVVPNRDGPGLSEDERVPEPKGYPRCTYCRHACAAEAYRTSYFIQPTGHVPAMKAAAYLDVYLRDRRSAVLYREEVRVKPNRLLVSYGGVFSLFLGMSVLSVVQFFFFIGRAVLAAIHVYFGDDFGHRLAVRMCAAIRHGLGAPPTPPPTGQRIR